MKFLVRRHAWEVDDFGGSNAPLIVAELANGKSANGRRGSARRFPKTALTRTVHSHDTHFRVV
jgi:hypothetical protein